MNDVHTITARKLRSLATAIRAERYAPHEFGVREAMEAEAVELEKRAAAIEEQAKAAIAEPMQFASVVRIKTGALFVRVGAIEPLPWASGEALRTWEQLDVDEVLRVGVEDSSPVSAYDEGYGNGQYAGFSQALGSAAERVSALRSEAITSERKSAYDAVLNLLLDLQP